jgi:hypothetical protein
MRSEKKNPWQKTRPTTWPLSIDEEQGPDQTKPADPAEELTTPEEEDIKQAMAEVPATPEAETTITGMANIAISANFRAIDRKNAGRG